MIPEVYNLVPEVRAAHEATNGHFNDFPPEWREITAKEFAQSRHFVYAPVLVEYRQMIPRDPETGMRGPALAARLEWQQNGTGFAVVNDHWAGAIKFYTFGVVPHGYVETHDSSD